MIYPVTFQSVSYTGSEFSSSSTRDVTNVLTTGATVRTLSGTERVNRGLEAAEVSILVTCNSSPALNDVGAEHLVTYSGDTYEVVYRDAVPNTNRASFLCRRI